jgi:single-stranded-DNA-specific exonuclease
MKTHANALLTAPLLLPQVSYDAELSLAEVTPELFAWITRCAPFGAGNTEPVFFTRAVILAAPVRRIKEKHIALRLVRDCATPLSVLGWSRGAAAWPDRCAQLGLAQGSSVDLLYRVKQNPGARFSGLELELCDLRTASSQARTGLPSDELQDRE